MIPMFFYKNGKSYVPCESVENGFLFLLKEGENEYRPMWVMDGKVISEEELTSINFTTKEECEKCYDFANIVLGFSDLEEKDKTIIFNETSSASQIVPVYVDNREGLYINTTNVKSILVKNINGILEKMNILSTSFRITRILKKITSEVGKYGYCILNNFNDVNFIDKSRFVIIDLGFDKEGVSYCIFDLDKVEEARNNGIPLLVNPKTEEERKILTDLANSFRRPLRCDVLIAKEVRS